jgi:hypothetical protein
MIVVDFENETYNAELKFDMDINSFGARGWYISVDADISEYTPRHVRRFFWSFRERDNCHVTKHNKLLVAFNDELWCRTFDSYYKVW